MSGGTGQWGTPPGGIPGGRAAQDERSQLDALLRRAGVADGVAGLERAGLVGTSSSQSAHGIVAQDHQRLVAPSRDALRAIAGQVTRGSGWTEDTSARFVGFIMKGALPKEAGGGWVIPFASWAEAAQSFSLLYSDQRVWDEWWRDVQ